VIDVERLDHLLNLVGELVIDRTRLLQLGRVLRDQVGEHRLLAELSETTLHLGRVTDELQAEVMKSRMLPVGTVFSRFPRVVRDLSNRQDKRVELIIEGQDTELDRTVIEEMPEYKKQGPEGKFGHYLIMAGALGGAACSAPGQWMDASSWR